MQISAFFVAHKSQQIIKYYSYDKTRKATNTWSKLRRKRSSRPKWGEFDMNMTNDAVTERNTRYQKYVASLTPQTGFWHSIIQSFVAGGVTCMIAQGIYDIYALIFTQMSQKDTATMMTMTVVALAILLTGLGWYDLLATFGGAGTFLPITGFANAMASASMEFRTEGLIFGTSVKMFSLVGPVIVNGVVWSSIIAAAKYLIMLWL